MWTKIILPLLICVALMGGAVLTVTGQDPIDAPDAAFVDQPDLNVTLLNGNRAVIEDTRRFDLLAGRNSVFFAGIAPSINLTSIAFEGDAIQVERQRYATQEPPFSLPVALEENVGEKVSFTTEDGEILEGTLLLFEGDILLQGEDGTLFTLRPSDITAYRLPNIRQDRQLEPGVRLLVNSDAAGEQAITLTYLQTGIAWNATYNLRLAADTRTLDMTGWLTLINNSGTSLDSARVTLAGGNTEVVDFASRDNQVALSATATALPSATHEGLSPTGGGGPASIASDIPFVLSLPNRVDLPTGQSQSIEFLEAADAQARNVFVYDASPRVTGFTGFNTIQDYGISGATEVLNFIAFSTGEDGLDRDLPPGVMRIYQEDADGGVLVLGEVPLIYTPRGETVQIFLDNSDEVTGERRQTEFVSLSTDAIQESFEIRIRNRQDEAIEMTIPERMTRSPSWEIVDSNTPFEQPTPNGIEFTVDVPAGGETTVTYTVLYTRPN